jgi:hypothetical protein
MSNVCGKILMEKKVNFREKFIDKTEITYIINNLNFWGNWYAYY